MQQQECSLIQPNRNAVYFRLFPNMPALLLQSESPSGMYATEASMDRIRIGYPAGYLRFFWIRIGFGYLFLKKIGSRQDQDICLISIAKFSWEWFKMSQMMMVLLFSLLLWFLYSQKIKMILSVCAALITIDDNSCYFIVNIFWQGGSSKLLLYCWYAALFCCAESSGIYVCCVG